MSRDNRELDRLRSGRTELENHYIDELVSGHISRRDFIRNGSMIGMSTTLLGAVLAACGSSSSSKTSAASATGTSSTPAAKGGTLRIGAQMPAAAINPLTIADAGGLLMLNQTGEFLIFDSNLKLELQPMLALSWSPNTDGSVWTFKLRPGVKFSNGSPMTADDVVYTFQQQSNPKGTANALSAFAGVLTPAGVKKVDSMTVEFSLEAPNGNFPYLVSSDNYNSIIVPNGTDFSKWQTTFIGTGAFKLASYTTNVGASFVPNVNYWGTKPLLDATSFKFYASQAPMILALQGGDIDVIAQFAPAGAAAILNNPSSYKIIKLTSASHRELSMRNDQAPFTDPRVRQAVAYTLDRPGAVAALLSGDGTVANDYPFGPRYPSTDTSVPQRTQDIAKAKQLLAAAGHPSGFTTTMNSEIYQEIPQLAQVIQQDASKAGINIKLNITNQTLYYGKTFGSSPWLDGTMSLVDYGDRGAPNVYLTAPLTSAGTWNAARFHNKTYDSLVKQYVAALDLQTQKQIAGKIENLLLQETPIVYPYWIDGLTASTPSVGGLNPTSIAQLYLNNAYKSA